MTNLFGLLQQQQAALKQHGELLQSTLRQQQEQSIQLNDFQAQLSTLEEKMDSVDTTALSSDISKKKIKITRELTVSYCII